MPLYTDSVIFYTQLRQDVVVSKYGIRALIVSDQSRPSRLIDVWVVSVADTDVLYRYRGEYKLGIICSSDISKEKNMELKNNSVICLTGPLTRPVSGACTILNRYRLVLPIIESLYKARLQNSTSSRLKLYEEFKSNYKMLYPMAEDSTKVSKDDIEALFKFDPFLSMYDRLTHIFLDISKSVGEAHIFQEIDQHIINHCIRHIKFCRPHLIK